jgi:hypothetical protein
MVHQHHVGPLLLQQAQGLAGVGRLPHHLDARHVPQQRGDARPDQGVVVRQQHANEAHRPSPLSPAAGAGGPSGKRARTFVPSPGADRMASCPPSSRTRSSMPSRPRLAPGALADVPGDAHEPAAVLAVAELAERNLQDDLPAAPVPPRQLPPFPRHTASAAGQVPGQGSLKAAAQRFRDQQGQVLIKQLLRRVAEQFQRRPVGEQDGALLVQHEDRSGDIFSDQAVALLAGAQLLRGFFIGHGENTSTPPGCKPGARPRSSEPAP